MESNAKISRIEQIDIGQLADHLRRMWNGARLNYIFALVGMALLLGPARTLFSFETSLSAQSLHLLTVMLALQIPFLVFVSGSISRFSVGLAIVLYLIDLWAILVVGNGALHSSDHPTFFYSIVLSMIVVWGLLTTFPIILATAPGGSIGIGALAHYNRRINRWPFWWRAGRLAVFLIMTITWWIAILGFLTGPANYQGYARKAAAASASSTIEIPTLGEVFQIFSGAGVTLIVMFLAIAVPVIYCLRLGRRWLRRLAEGRAAMSARDPILLLRSFADDKARVQPNHLGMRAQFRKMRLEEVVASIIAPIGTFIGIGTPNERLPQLGAQRAYFDDDKWQSAILDWISKSRFVVMITGLTPWVQWEFKILIETSRLSRLVVLFPPADSEMTEQRLKLVRECFSETKWAAAITNVESKRIVALLCLEEGLVVVFNGRRRDEIEYRLAMLATMRRIGVEPRITGKESVVK